MVFWYFFHAKPIISGDHYSEDTSYYLEDRVRVVSLRLPRTRERTGVRIDFWCVSHQTFILFSEIKQYIYSHANYTFAAHIAGIACFRNHVLLASVSNASPNLAVKCLTWGIWGRCLAGRLLAGMRRARRSTKLSEIKTSHLNYSMRFEPISFIFAALESAHSALRKPSFT